MFKHLPARPLLQRFGLLTGILFFLAMADAFVSSHLDDSHTLRALPGTRHPISGTLTLTVRALSDLNYRSSPQGLTLSFAELQGRMWRGVVQVAPCAAPGTYLLQVFGGPRPAEGESAAHRILVFETRAELNASYPSICRKTLGLAPWWIMAVTLPLLIVALGLSYYTSSLREVFLEQQGIFAILKLARRKDHWELGFGRQNFRAGDRLRLLNAELEPAGEVQIHAIQDGLAIARLELSAVITPDYLVQRIGSLSTPD
jgi:hypothetical protein